MKKVHIIYGRFYNYSGDKLFIGGVETYLINLSKLMYENGYEVHIYQYADVVFNINDDYATIHGIIPDNKKEKENYNSFKTLVKAAENNGNVEKDVLIFGADLGVVKTKYKNVVAIQHGIGWDIQPDSNSSLIRKIKYSITNFRIALNRKKKIAICKKIVCVDYNFLNWYRTTIYDNVDKIKVIPNFTQLVPYKKRQNKKNVSIIFARRFQHYRGTRVFAEAVEKLINKYSNVKVTVAGEGPDEKWLHDKLDKYNQVTFDKFAPEDSLNYHKLYDIAVVPSTGSEGTSLSLLEAMAAGCAVICSDIGGLTNIILDNYNGLIIRANADDLYQALVKLLDYNYREELAQNGYHTVCKSFSFDKWGKSWMDIINNL